LRRNWARKTGYGLSGAFLLFAVAGWCEHIYSCFVERSWVYLIAGAILSPLGIVHGWGIWFGWWH